MKITIRDDAGEDDDEEEVGLIRGKLLDLHAGLDA